MLILIWLRATKTCDPMCCAKIVRYLLEKANSVKDAKELLLKLPVSSNCNILLTDNSGDMIVVECSPKGKNIRKPIKIQH